MYTSVMLAQVLGLFYAILGFGIMLNRDHIDKVMSAVTRNHAIQLIATIIPLLFGSYLIVIHNRWEANWTVIVTVVAWLIFLAGVFRAIFPNLWIERVKHAQKSVPMVVYGAILFVLGAVLLFFGIRHGFIR